MYLRHMIEQTPIRLGRQAVRNQSQTLSSKCMHVCAHLHTHTHTHKKTKVSMSQTACYDKYFSDAEVAINIRMENKLKRTKELELIIV